MEEGDDDIDVSRKSESEPVCTFSAHKKFEVYALQFTMLVSSSNYSNNLNALSQCIRVFTDVIMLHRVLYNESHLYLA